MARDCSSRGKCRAICSRACSDRVAEHEVAGVAQVQEHDCVVELLPNDQARSMVCAIAAMLAKKEALFSKTASFPLTGGLLPSWNVTDGERNGSRFRVSRVSTASGVDGLVELGDLLICLPGGQRVGGSGVVGIHVVLLRCVMGECVVLG